MIDRSRTMLHSAITTLTALVLLGFGASRADAQASTAAAPAAKALGAGAGAAAALDTATFAAGCFWCAESDFEKVPGVVDAVSGYIGGKLANPTYEQVSGGGTGHYESVQVVYDPMRVTYDQLLTTFWHNVDPVDARGQFCDKGPQYRAAVFYHTDAERRAAERSKQGIEQLPALAGQHAVTEILPAGTFYTAEEYHQAYYRKNPVRYKFYRWNCGRDQRLAQLWGSAAAHAESGR